MPGGLPAAAQGTLAAAAAAVAAAASCLLAALALHRVPMSADMQVIFFFLLGGYRVR